MRTSSWFVVAIVALASAAACSKGRAGPVEPPLMGSAKWRTAEGCQRFLDVSVATGGGTLRIAGRDVPPGPKGFSEISLAEADAPKGDHVAAELVGGRRAGAIRIPKRFSAEKSVIVPAPVSGPGDDLWTVRARFVDDPLGMKDRPASRLRDDGTLAVRFDGCHIKSAKLITGEGTVEVDERGFTLVVDPLKKHPKEQFVEVKARIEVTFTNAPPRSLEIEGSVALRTMLGRVFGGLPEKPIAWAPAAREPGTGGNALLVLDSPIFSVGVDWGARDAALIGRVIEKKPVKVGSCGTYVDAEGKKIRSDKIRLDADVVIFEARTGRERARKLFRGKTGCPEVIHTLKGETKVEIGNFADWNAIVPWLKAEAVR